MKTKTTRPGFSRYARQPRLRTSLSLAASLGVNLAYALFQLALGILDASLWCCALAGYYGLLTAMRAGLLREVRRDRLGLDLAREYRLYRRCGLLLGAMGMVTGVIAAFIVQGNRGSAHSPIAAIAMATYTFYAFTMAVLNLIRYRKHPSPVLSADKTIRFAAAMMSMLSLENAMLAVFNGDPDFRRVLTAVTGGVVHLAVLTMAARMVTVGDRGLKGLSKVQSAKTGP